MRIPLGPSDKKTRPFHHFSTAIGIESDRLIYWDMLGLPHIASILMEKNIKKRPHLFSSLVPLLLGHIMIHPMPIPTSLGNGQPASRFTWA